MRATLHYINRSFERSIAMFAAFAAIILAALVARKLLLTSIFITTIFCFPSLIQESRHAGFLYTGDIIGYYWPFLERINELLGAFTFTGIDIGHFNGSSELFLTSNVYSIHPIFSLYSILPLPKPSHQQLGNIIVWVIAFHFFIFFYFSARLLSEFVSVHYGVALFGAAVAAFGSGAIGTLFEPEFLYSISSVSWCIYASLQFARTRNFLNLPVAAIPTVLFVAGGYLPLGISALFMAVASIVFYITVIQTDLATFAERIRALILAALPIAIGLIVCGPFLWASYVFLEASPSAGTASLFYSAHQMSELPQSVIRVLTSTFASPGPYYELSLQLGLIPVAIILLFLANINAVRVHSERDWDLLKFSAAAYAVTALAVYGAYSPFSDLIFYLVPQVGKMHIYQRFLLPGQLLIAIALAVMLHGLLHEEKQIPFGKIATVSFIVTLAAAFFVGRYPEEAVNWGLNNHLIFEFLVLTLFIASLAMPGYYFKSVVALCLVCLPSLGAMYNWSRNQEQAQQMVAKQPLFLDAAYQQQVAGFMRRYTDKDLVKYIDTTARWHSTGVEPFPKSFPYVMSKWIELSSYGGFNFYLAAREDYAVKMPYLGADVRQSPDWEWLKATGADFIVAPNTDMERLQNAGYVSTEPGSLMQLPYEVVLAPLTLGSPVASETVFDNGYLRVSEYNENAGAADNLALHRPARQSSTSGTGAANLAVDGNVDGNYSAGSVTHTERSDDAWWEVDLGSEKSIGEIIISARADCCPGRSENVWLLVSNEPFGESETASEARAKVGVWSRLLIELDAPVSIPDALSSGRYVRLQFDGAARGEAGYLSVAEVQVLEKYPLSQSQVSDAAKPDQVVSFQTDRAGWVWADIVASSPLKVDYLFWYNPRLRFLVDGQVVEPMNNGGLRSVVIPSGEHTLEIKVVNRPLSIFWIVYAVFWLGVLVSVVISVVLALAGPIKQRRTTGRHV